MTRISFPTLRVRDDIILVGRLALLHLQLTYPTCDYLLVIYEHKKYNKKDKKSYQHWYNNFVPFSKQLEQYWD